MAVLVTGASGFLGGRLAQMLAARGEAVRVLARPASDFSHLQGLPVEVVHGTLADAERLAAAVKGVSRVFHCAGCSTDWAPWSLHYAANVEGLRNLLLAASRVDRLQRFLHVSSTDVYGYPRDPCEESHPLTDVGLPYNRSKCLGEACVRDSARVSGLPVTIVRPASIYGPRGAAFTINVARLIRRGLMAVIDGGRTPGGFCYVDNAARAILLAAESGRAVGRAYNVADGTGVTWRAYLDALADGLGVRRPWIDIPSKIAFPLARALEASHRYVRLPGRPLLTRHAVLVLSRNQEYPTVRARQDLGFSPQVSFDEGTARTIRWLKEE